MQHLSKIVLAVMVVCCLTACRFDDFEELQSFADTTPERNTYITELRNQYNNGTRRIEQGIVIAGHVTANDVAGNFYRSFLVQDASGGVEICAGFYDVHALYGIGRYVIMDTRGLWLDEYNGVIRLGRTVKDYADYTVEGFGSVALLREYAYAEDLFGIVKPEVKRIDELTEDACGSLVTVGKLLFHRDTVVTWAGADALKGRFSNGVHRFKDGRGDSILVVTSSYCDFARHLVPTDSVALTGILMYGSFNNSKPLFALKLRDTNDIEVEE